MPSRSPIEGLRVLIADDDELLRGVLRSGLARMGARVADAASGSAALEELARNNYDVLLLDGWMPGGDATSVLEQLASGAGPVVVVLTGGENQAADGRSFEELGAASVVQKPIRMQDLATELAKAVAARPRRTNART
jgi:CheY-like chemotaxis protein